MRNYVQPRFLVAIVAVLVLVSGCEISDKTAPYPRVLRDLVFTDGKNESQYLIWLAENGTDVPYLVLTDNYEGTNMCLLLRKHTLETPMRFHVNQPYSAYYPECELDHFLNHDFLANFPDTLDICQAPVRVTGWSSLGVCGKQIETISRKVFLLSAMEVFGRSSTTLLQEGSHLDYFSSESRRIAKNTTGASMTWWLRTPNTWYDNIICGVSIDGVVALGSAGGVLGENLSGVRPAFCLSGDTPIYYREGRFYIS